MSKHLTIGSVKELEMIQGNILHSLKVLTFLDFDESDIFPYGFLEQMPNIEKLEVRKSRLKEIFCLQNPNIDDSYEFLSHLKELCLDSLPNLVSIGLENMVSSTSSFSNLTYLKVYKCMRLSYLLTYSTAKSLVELRTMEIKWCNSIEKIVVCDKEGGESNEDEIIFPHLKCLTLDYVPKLRSFYEGSVNFPSLDQLKIELCQRMETLCAGTIKTGKPLQVKLDYFYGLLIEADLNSLLMNAFLKRTRSLVIEHRPKLQEMWLESMLNPIICFSELISLIVDGCQFLSDAVLPSHLLPFFTKLTTLQVRKCDHVKTIFDVKCAKEDTKPPLHLKKLTLSELSNLENVWNKDPEGLLRMQHLCEVKINNCKKLPNVFPASIANDIEKLENLVVKRCKEFMTIVAEDDAYQRETFLYVQSLTLCDLPKFKYSDTCFIHDVTTSKLEHLTLGDNELKMILGHLTLGDNVLKKILHLQEEGRGGKEEAAVGARERGGEAGEEGGREGGGKGEGGEKGEGEEEEEEEGRGEDANELKKILHLQQQQQFLEKLIPKLKVFALLLQYKSDEFVQQVSKAENLVVCDDSFKEIELKVLHSKSLRELISIGSKNSWIESFLIENIKSFEVISCFCSTSLLSCTMSFSNVTDLDVNQCKELLYLLTSSTAKSLVQLKTMKIQWCDSIKEIVVCNKKTSDSTEDEIIFPHLKCLTLHGLPKLRSFYKGSLGFPSLDQLEVTTCNMLKYLLTSSTTKSLVPLKKMEIQWCDSIEEIIVCNNEGDESTEDEIIFPHLNYLTLNGLPKLKSFYKGSLGFPLLDQLKVTNCDMLKYLLTSSTAKSLVQLKTMLIQWCDSIEEIIVCNKKEDESTEDEIIFSHLNYLTLNGLPKLRSFYKGSLGFPLLDELKVINCHMLKYLLTSLTAKSLVQLKTMKIASCNSIKEIIVCNKKEDKPNEDEIKFMHLTSLTLEELPTLRRFYKGSLSFPSLDKLNVSSCHRMKTDLNSFMRKRNPLIDDDFASEEEELISNVSTFDDEDSSEN